MQRQQRAADGTRVAADAAELEPVGIIRDADALG